MKNGDIEIGPDGRKWEYFNGSFYLYDDRDIEEIEQDLSNYILNNSKEIARIAKTLYKIEYGISFEEKMKKIDEKYK